jgi:hypothetical protein
MIVAEVDSIAAVEVDSTVATGTAVDSTVAAGTTVDSTVAAEMSDQKIFLLT